MVLVDEEACSEMEKAFARAVGEETRVHCRAIPCDEFANGTAPPFG